MMAEPRPHRGPAQDQLRLMAKVARLYHERGIRQPQIAADLHISQSRVSRLLKQAQDAGIVRTIVTLPVGVHTDLEDDLAAQYGLLDAVVIEADGHGGATDLLGSLGSAASAYLGETLTGGEIVGISSWSATLLATVEAMRPRNGAAVKVVTQMLGGVGDPQVQVSATRLLDRFANLTGARPIFLPTPGLLHDAAVQAALLRDPAVAGVVDAWSRLDVALVGIGSLQPSPLAARSGNAVGADEQDELHALGAVGDVCFRFFDNHGELVISPFNDRVVGITPAALKAVPRRIGVAGGPEKYRAIRAALLGSWVNTLITDTDTARALVQTR